MNSLTQIVFHKHAWEKLSKSVAISLHIHLRIYVFREAWRWIAAVTVQALSTQLSKQRLIKAV